MMSDQVMYAQVLDICKLLIQCCILYNWVDIVIGLLAWGHLMPFTFFKSINVIPFNCFSLFHTGVVFSGMIVCATYFELLEQITTGHSYLFCF